MTEIELPAIRHKSGRFVKGVSPNPTGRPKESKEVRDLARTHTVAAIERLAHWMASDNAKASISASNALLDRGYGKAPQTLDGLEDGEQLIVQVISYTPKLEEVDGR